MKKLIPILIIFFLGCATVPTHPVQYMSDDELKREYWADLNAYTSLERDSYIYGGQSGGGLFGFVEESSRHSNLNKVQNRLTEIRTEMSIRGVYP